MDLIRGGDREALLPPLRPLQPHWCFKLQQVHICLSRLLWQLSLWEMRRYMMTLTLRQRIETRYIYILISSPPPPSFSISLPFLSRSFSIFSMISSHTFLSRWLYITLFSRFFSLRREWGRVYIEVYYEIVYFLSHRMPSPYSFPLFYLYILSLRRDICLSFSLFSL